jgi:ferrous iron transport protein B
MDGWLLESVGFKSNTVQANETIARYVRINELLLDVVRMKKRKKKRNSATSSTRF